MALDSSVVAVKYVYPERSAPRRAGLSLRRHPFSVLAFQVAGELEVEHGGRHRVEAGDFHLIPAGHAHAVTAARESEVWCVMIPGKLLDRERHGEIVQPVERIARGALPRVRVPEERRGFVTSLFTELATLEAGRAPSIRGESLLLLLLAELGMHAPALPGDDGPGQAKRRRHRDDLATRAISFIAENALSPLSLEDVARAVGRNRTHVADVVRRTTGQTVGELITELRLDEARRRLEHTDELVEVIAERVGYADPTHFTRMFRRRFGQSPRAYRAAEAADQKSVPARQAGKNWIGP